MKLFCKHKMKEIERAYAKPIGRVNYHATQKEDRINYGFTTILYCCEKCGHMEKVELLGMVINNSHEAS